VLLDVRWGNDVVSPDSPEAVLQIGFSTALASDRRQLPPVNLSLVIDKSGSMADADKLSRVKEALLTNVEYGPGLELVQVYGYEPRRSEGSVSFKLDNMNQGLTQVVLLRFRVTRRGLDTAQLPVKVRFGYYDLERKSPYVRTQEAFLTLRDGRAAPDMLRDTEVSKNFTIAQLAQAIRDMAAECESHRYREAERLLNAAIARTYQRYPDLADEDISRTLFIAQKYQEVVRKYNQEQAPKNER
jgi:hypothetical protein